ncbi:(d)CMP kinase [Balneolaceae bacterium YR4-1]|uniref:Cytidylate kinase n=1 Tax=Halalkalibaculum roseum TaxID=2709311 RepID=A0A6M1SZF5_9BACT|nr:(d)CMP kinase [Halalkalibaculum roseum]NGP75967.1 (d)CMP kinase [Halalkalibaculum roseum]
MIIVIDGPAGAGKSTTAKAVAKKLGIQYLDSGALYRALTVIYLESGKDADSFFKKLKDKDITFKYTDEQFRVWLNEKDITDKLRSSNVADEVSTVASLLKSRERVNELMREAVEHDTYIAEGRDLGTAVFPDADLKFFMKADVNERARRRYEELLEAGEETSLKKVKQNILERDYKDSQRKTDPLKQADDAIIVDTTNLDFEQQVAQICSDITDKLELPIKQ